MFRSSRWFHFPAHFLVFSLSFLNPTFALRPTGVEESEGPAGTKRQLVARLTSRPVSAGAEEITPGNGRTLFFDSPKIEPTLAYLQAHENVSARMSPIFREFLQGRWTIPGAVRRLAQVRAADRSYLDPEVLQRLLIQSWITVQFDLSQENGLFLAALAVAPPIGPNQVVYALRSEENVSAGWGEVLAQLEHLTDGAKAESRLMRSFYRVLDWAEHKITDQSLAELENAFTGPGQEAEPGVVSIEEKEDRLAVFCLLLFSTEDVLLDEDHLSLLVRFLVLERSGAFWGLPDELLGPALKSVMVEMEQVDPALLRALRLAGPSLNNSERSARANLAAVGAHVVVLALFPIMEATETRGGRDVLERSETLFARFARFAVTEARNHIGQEDLWAADFLTIYQAAGAEEWVTLLAGLPRPETQEVGQRVDRNQCAAAVELLVGV